MGTVPFASKRQRIAVVGFVLLGVLAFSPVAQAAGSRWRCYLQNVAKFFAGAESDGAQSVFPPRWAEGQVGVAENILKVLDEAVRAKRIREVTARTVIRTLGEHGLRGDEDSVLHNALVDMLGSDPKQLALRYGQFLDQRLRNRRSNRDLFRPTIEERHALFDAVKRGESLSLDPTERKRQLMMILGDMEGVQCIGDAMTYLVFAKHLSAVEKAKLWNELATLIEVYKNSGWVSFPAERGSKGAYVFQGARGVSLVIDAQGNLYRGIIPRLAIGELWNEGREMKHMREISPDERKIPGEAGWPSKRR